MSEKKGAAKQAAKEKAEAHLAAIVDSSDDAIISKTLDGIVTSWNRGAERLYGYSAGEAVGRPVSLLVPPSRREELRRVSEQIAAGESVEHLETVRITKAGKEVCVSLTISPILDADGRVVGVSTIARDITERMWMERLLRESEKRYRTLVERAPDAVIVHQEGRFVYANCAALGIYGATSLEELQQCTLLDLVHADDRAAVAERVEQLLEGEEIPLREYRLLRLSGEEIAVETSSTLVDYQGKPSIQTIARDITARKRSERERENMIRELATQRSRFETVVRQIPIGLLIAEAPGGKVIYHNEQARTVFRQDLNDLKRLADYGRLGIRRMDGSLLPVESCPVVRALRGETVAEQELRIGPDDGPPRFIRINATPLRDAAGAVVSSLTTFSDVTEGRAAAKALADSEQRLQLALDAAEMGSCDMEVTSGRGVWSRRHFLLFGYPPPAGGSAPAEIGMWQSLIHPDDREQVVEGLERARREGALYRSEHRIVRADNHQAVWVNVQGRFLCDPTGAGCRFIGVVYDVTERRASEELLRRSEQRFRLLTDSMPQIAWTAEPDGTVDYINLHFELYTGIEREGRWLRNRLEHPEQLIREVVHPEDVERTADAWQKAVAGGGIYQSEARLRRIDGAYRWHLSRAIAERDEGARIVKWYGTATDINDLREIQEQLQNSEQKFRWLYESNMIAVFFWNRDGNITEANQAFCDLVGYSHDQCRAGAMNWIEITPPEYCAADLAAFDEIMVRGICKPFEKEFLNRQGNYRVSALIAGAKMPGSEAVGIGFAVDLTELKHAEQALKGEVAERLRAVEELARQEQLLIRQGRLAAMGEMIGNIAHQWRQPLNTLGLIVQELPRYYDRELFSREYLESSVTRAMQVINYMSKTIDGFRNFFGPDKEREEFRAAEVLVRTISIVEAAFKELKLQIELSADPELVIFGYPNEFSQAVLNILVNAKDALLERKVAEPRVVVRLFAAGGKGVLTIADNAGGIPPEIADRIFDPYFTTKGPEQGTGIGLFMCKTIIEKNMHGRLTVHNTAEGAEFRIEV